ncbi:DUF2529 family protein [Alkalihalobacterium bogoriense]|uniref:DUF2529 family protein n=1 Tax=Alkalihalobacterium bogoriense TaxID=246272 RepID=UPI00047E6000|nr:DUF2529 family protein [Alkalihalobacterium bogoriense]
MLQIFQTQFIGVLKQIKDQEETIEECGRALAQAVVGEGTIYIIADKEMTPIASAIVHADKTNQMEALDKENIAIITPADRVVYFTSYSSAGDMAMIESLLERHITVIGIAGKDHPGIDQICDFFINMFLVHGLVPTDEGERIGQPFVSVGLYVFELLSLALTDILSEYEE